MIGNLTLPSIMNQTKNQNNFLYLDLDTLINFKKTKTLKSIPPILHNPETKKKKSQAN